MSARPLTCVPGYCSSDSVCELETHGMKCRHCKYSGDDADDRCRLRAVSFPGDAMLNVNEDLSRMHWRVEFRIATIAHDGVIFFTGYKKSDFVELSISERVLKAHFSLGGESVEMRMDNDPENRVNDGEWHTIVLELAERKLTVSLDGCDAKTALILKNSPVCAASAEIVLPSKCLSDPTVPCFRFLDVTNGIFLGGRPGSSKQIEEAFNGCLKDLKINEKLVDFSKMKEMHRVGQVVEGCRPLSDHCKKNSCSPSTKCTNRWGGFNCRCPHSIHHKGTCRIDQISTHARPVSLAEEESFVLYKPGSISPPFFLSAEFRTSRIDTQILAVEFNQRSVFFKLDVEDGVIRFSLSESSIVVPGPEFSSKNWVHADIAFGESTVKVTVDNIYTAELPAFLGETTLDVVYIGLAPSTGHPSRFEGCVRNVEIDGRPVSVHQKGKVRQGCVVHNRCALEGVCPTESSCQRLWNKHRCVCHKGFVGDVCQPVCSLKDVCSGGSCVPSNTTDGYECICQPGKTGKNCELIAATAMCPAGWWGSFPKCKKCSCDLHKGFQSQCDKQTGACLCLKTYYATINGCARCECGDGAENGECSIAGHCKCLGEAVGRRCDRCPKFDHALDSKTLKCHKIDSRCPSEVEYAIKWPSSIKGSTVRQSCPDGETGLATRKCLDSGRWSDVNSWNCTRPEYSIMVNKFGILDSSKLLAMVNNATVNEATIRGRNQQIAAEAISAIIDFELKLEPSARSHIKDMRFTEDLMKAAGKVLAEHPPSEYLPLTSKLLDYAHSVFDSHTKMTFLPPFFAANDHIAFGFDRVDFGNTLPKFNNFIDTRPKDFSKVNIHLQGTTQALYAILPFPRCERCGNPLVLILANSSQPVTVEFVLRSKDAWIDPECVQLKSGKWRKTGVEIGVNISHVRCQFEGEGLFTMFSSDQSNSYVRMAHSQDLTPPILAATSLFLCALSLLATFSRNVLKTRMIRIGFIILFAFNLVDLYFLHFVSIKESVCPLRNAFLSFTSCAPFAWLFLYSLHIYRTLADGSAKASWTTCMLLGLASPAVFASTTFFFASSCTLSPETWLLWFILAPIVLFLLLSFYASATCFLVTMNKNYENFPIKFNLRKALFQHFILTASTVLCTAFALASPFIPFSSKIMDVVKCSVFLASSAVVFFWSAFASISKSRKEVTNMWLDPQKSIMAESTMADRQCESPLLPPGFPDDSVGNNDWMPDVIPAETYATTPRRQPHLSDAVHHILSPAEKILDEGIGHVYGNVGTLPRLRSAQDEADDAYYTYTASRRYKPSTTFNRD
ncbi:unnamed protein product [Caenorhabditis auriculariae]|uniref:Uncharacterized protein n=1 Tax=Caenorhabditis auriculariae TaxID=2777116 RepID=A0A8S1HHE0_9PELO|nr:unnamed protein product [Caenorhabditis auriculariae]